jgi:hypothetical protein
MARNSPDRFEEPIHSTGKNRRKIRILPSLTYMALASQQPLAPPKRFGMVLAVEIGVAANALP